MVREGSVFGSLVAGIAAGLAFLVYGMWLSAGQSWNTPSSVGGVLILGAVAIMVVRIANLQEPAH